MSRPEHASLPIAPLTKELAVAHTDEIVTLMNDIPEVTYSAEDLLAEEKADGRRLHAKWDTSYAVFDGDQAVGAITAYERPPEPGTHYERQSVHLCDIAVAREYRARRLGAVLFSHLLSVSLARGYVELGNDEPLCFSLQTNAGEFNMGVQEFCRSFGFFEVGEYTHKNRTNLVMFAEPEDIVIKR